MTVIDAVLMRHIYKHTSIFVRKKASELNELCVRSAYCSLFVNYVYAKSALKNIQKSIDVDFNRFVVRIFIANVRVYCVSLLILFFAGF